MILSSKSLATPDVIRNLDDWSRSSFLSMRIDFSGVLDAMAGKDFSGTESVRRNN